MAKASDKSMVATITEATGDKPVERIEAAQAGSNSEHTPTTTIRVLHLINGEHYSGAERVQDLLAKTLPDEGFDVGFVCLKPDKFSQRRKYQAAPLYELSMAGRFDLRAAWQVARIARREDYKLLHAHTPRSAMIGRVAASLSGLPLVYHVHSPTSQDSTHAFRNWGNQRIEWMSIRQCARVVTVSQSLSRHMQTIGFPAERISVVPNGVPSRRQRRERPRPTGTWTLGTVALFRPRKGTEILIDALALLRQEGRNVKLLGVGPFESEDYQRELVTQVQRHSLDNAVTWTGFTSNVDDQLDQMDLFVLPSLFGEGMPMVVLEAMAAGVPVVATDVEGVPEVIRHGQDGMIAPAGSPSELAAAIATVMDGRPDWSELRDSAMRRQAEQFSDISMARGVAEAYRAVLQANPA